MAHFPGSMRFDDSLSTLFDDEEQELLNKQFDGEIEAKSNNNNNNNKTIQWRKQLPRSHVYRPLQTRFQRLVQLSDVLNTAVWKMCLMSVDPRGRMLFIASKHQILCFDISPVDDSLLNPTKPQKILDPFPLDGAPRGARALFSRDEINQIRAGYLGNEPVLMSVHDSGNVRVFFIDNLDRAPIAVSNNGESTWSLACCCKGTSDKKRYLAVGANNHCVTFWNLGINGEGDNNDGDHSSTNDTSHRTTIRSNKIILRGHDHNIPAVDFDPQGNFIASASIDRTVRIWDTKQAKEVARKKLCAEWCWGVRWIEPECIKVIPESNTNAWLAIKKRLGRGEYSVNYMSDDNLEEEEEEQEEEQEEQEEEEEEEEGQEEHDEATEEEEEEEEVGEWTEDSSHGDGSSGTDVEDDDERTSGDENSTQEQMQGSRQRSNIAEDAQITATAAPLQQPAGPSLSTTSASNGVSPLAKKEILAMSNFLLCTTKHHVFLLDNHMHIQASIYINNFHGRRNLPSWHTGLNRLSLLEFIPELSVVVVASQVDTQVLLLRVVRNEDGTRYALVPEATFPPRSLHIGPIIGISVAKARQQSPAASPSSGAAAMAALNVSYNIYILTMDKNLFTYEVHRDMDTDSLDYSRVLL